MRLVVKYGGNAMDGAADRLLLEELAARQRAGEHVVLVHGGGPEIDRALEQRGIPTRRVDGLRVTDAATLDVTEAVLCGTLNKRLVRACARQGIAAVGISAEDGGLLRARRATAPGGGDLGYVGEIAEVNVAALVALLEAGFMPVVAPLAISQDAAHAYNVNADTAAGAIAAALRADAFVAITNVPRVLRDPDDPGSALHALTLEQARVFAQSPGCRQSMRPKILAAIAAVHGGAKRAYICAARERTVAAALAGDATVVTP